MKQIIYMAGIAIASTMAIASCSNQAEWKLSGVIEGASDTTAVLEAANPAGYWYTLDSIDINNDGTFATNQPASQYPDIYRLNYGGNYIYFPIDSIEHLSLKANAANFSTSYELTGSDNANLITHVEKRLNGFLKNHKTADLDTARTLKRELSGMILGDPSSIVAFYIVNKQIDGKRLFRTDNRKELGLIGAVANAYTVEKASDPRTQFLKQLWIKNKSQFSTQADTLIAHELPLIDIIALDEKGIERKLSDVAASNKTVILNFTDYSADYSQALNLTLRELYDANRAKGLEIFQLGFSNNEFQWRVSAANQPWTTVFNATTDTNLMNYNVGALPAIFIIHNGELVERATSVENMKKAIGRYL